MVGMVPRRSTPEEWKRDEDWELPAFEEAVRECAGRYNLIPQDGFLRVGCRVVNSGRMLGTDRFRVDMLRLKSFFCLGLCLGCGSIMAAGQAVPTASQASSLSVFGGLTGVYTDLDGGRNVGITAGVDYTVGGYRRFHPGLEIRGTYPIVDGTQAKEKDALVGVRVTHQTGPFNLYGDFLFGRGEIKYIAPFDVGTLQYLATDTNIYSPGVGAEYDLTHHFAVRADAQYERWGTPAVASGAVWETVLTGAVTYKFDFNHHFKRPKRDFDPAISNH